MKTTLQVLIPDKHLSICMATQIILKQKNESQSNWLCDQLWKYLKQLIKPIYIYPIRRPITTSMDQYGPYGTYTLTKK